MPNFNNSYSYYYYDVWTLGIHCGYHYKYKPHNHNGQSTVPFDGTTGMAEKVGASSQITRSAIAQLLKHPEKINFGDDRRSDSAGQSKDNTKAVDAGSVTHTDSSDEHVSLLSRFNEAQKKTLIISQASHTTKEGSIDQSALPAEDQPRIQTQISSQPEELKQTVSCALVMGYVEELHYSSSGCYCETDWSPSLYLSKQRERDVDFNDHPTTTSSSVILRLRVQHYFISARTILIQLVWYGLDTTVLEMEISRPITRGLDHYRWSLRLRT